MKIRTINLEEGFDPNLVIHNPVPVNAKTNKFTEDGVFSERIFGSLESNNEYSCECGNLLGHFNKDIICKECNTIVRYGKSNLTKKGWIDLEEYQVINPYMYYQIIKIVKDLPKIIQFDPKINLNGKIISDEIPYFNIGLKAFIEKFEEIINFYYDKSNKKEQLDEIVNFIISNADKLFISKIPVYSPLLRPAHMINKTLKLAEENTFFNQIIRNIEIIKEKEGIEKLDLSIYPLLYEIQIALNSIFEKTLNQLSGKTGFLRNTLLGNRVNFSTRTVIGPMPKGYKMNELFYPYLAAVEMYKYEIINILSNSEGYTKAHDSWNEATLRHSDKVYSVLEELLHKSKGGLSMLVNRNPSIDFGSILYCKVIKIKKDMDDLTLNISNSIISLLSADYDGDVITTISIKDNSYKNIFSVFDPRKMIVSNDTGMFNSRMKLKKDYSMGIHTLVS